MEITQEMGIAMYEAAGYTMHVGEKTFTIFEDGKKVAGYSNIEWLSSMGFIIKDLQRISANKGYMNGYKEFQNQFRNLIGIRND